MLLEGAITLGFEINGEVLPMIILWLF